MAKGRNVSLKESQIKMGNGTIQYTYKVLSLTNTLTPHVGDILDENGVKSLMRRRDIDVTIRAQCADGELDSSVCLVVSCSPTSPDTDRPDRPTSHPAERERTYKYMVRSVHLLKLKREGFYGVIKTRGSVKPLNTSMLDEKQVASLRKRGFKITTVNRVW